MPLAVSNSHHTCTSKFKVLTRNLCQNTHSDEKLSFKRKGGVHTFLFAHSSFWCLGSLINSKTCPHPGHSTSTLLALEEKAASSNAWAFSAATRRSKSDTLLISASRSTLVDSNFSFCSCENNCVCFCFFMI